MINHKVSGLKIRKSGSNYKVRNNTAKIDTNIIDNHINSTILNKINGKDPTVSKKIFTSQNPYTPQFIRNPDCWLNGISNISCASPAQLSGSNWFQRAGTLISPRHVLLAKHYTIGLGYDLRFVADDNTVVTRTLKDMVLANDDIAMYLLDKDVPSNIKFAKVLPRNHSSYFFQGTKIRYAIFFDQEEKALLGVNTYLPYIENPPGSQNVVYVTNPNYISGYDDILDPIKPWYETPIAGDSGDPMFLLIDNELVLISCWTTPVNGPAYPALYDRLNSLMNQLGGGYNLTPIDLDSVYNKYK